MKFVHIYHSTVSTDCSHAAFVAVLKRPPVLGPAQIVGQIATHLYCHLCHLRMSTRIALRCHQRYIAEGVDIDQTLNAVILIDYEAASWPRLYIRTFNNNWLTNDTCSPYHRRCLKRRTVGEANHVAVVIFHRHIEAHVDTQLLQAAESIGRQPEAEGKIRTTLMLGLVFIETAIIYALLVVILIIFVL